MTDVESASSRREAIAPGGGAAAESGACTGRTSLDGEQAVSLLLEEGRPAARQTVTKCRLAWCGAALLVVAVVVCAAALAKPAEPAEPAEIPQKVRRRIPQQKVIVERSPGTAASAAKSTWDADSYIAGVDFGPCDGLLEKNTGVLAVDDVTGSIVVQGPLPGCYPPTRAYEAVIRAAIARAKMRPVMTDHETEALISPDSFRLSDYELVFVDFLGDIELDDKEWQGIAGTSYHSVQPSNDQWIRRSACGAGGCGFQVGNTLPYDIHAPKPPGGWAAYDFIHDLMTHRMDLPNGSNRKRLVFFHCASGVDRAGTVSLSYKMAYQHMSLPQAVTSLRAAKDYRPLPNTDFQALFMIWCYSLHKTTSGVCEIPPVESGWAVREYPADLSGRLLPLPQLYSTTTTTPTTDDLEGAVSELLGRFLLDAPMV